MAPHVEDDHVPQNASNGIKSMTNGHSVKEAAHDQTKPSQHTESKEPLKLKGTLNQYDSFDVNPVIVREFENVDLAEWLKASNPDELLRDLAITISQRGVVSFRAQDDLNDDLQKELAQRLGKPSGKAEDSGLYTHPVSNAERGNGGKDNEISIISSVQAKRIYKGSARDPSTKNQSGKDGWHSDITFEPVPSDYALLRLIELPGSSGGRTV